MNLDRSGRISDRASRLMEHERVADADMNAALDLVEVMTETQVRVAESKLPAGGWRFLGVALTRFALVAYTEAAKEGGPR